MICAPQVIPGIQGILFKDLKQIFRKEQCDATLMLTANVPSAKRIIVHGPQGENTISAFGCSVYTSLICTASLNWLWLKIITYLYRCVTPR